MVTEKSALDFSHYAICKFFERRTEIFLRTQIKINFTSMIEFIHVGIKKKKHRRKWRKCWFPAFSPFPAMLSEKISLS